MVYKSTNNARAGALAAEQSVLESDAPPSMLLSRHSALKPGAQDKKPVAGGKDVVFDDDVAGLIEEASRYIRASLDNKLNRQSRKDNNLLLDDMFRDINTDHLPESLCRCMKHGFDSRRPRRRGTRPQRTDPVHRPQRDPIRKCTATQTT